MQHFLLVNTFVDILLIVLISLLGVYIILFLIFLFSALSKKKELNKKALSMNLVFTQKVSLLIELSSYLTEVGYKENLDNTAKLLEIKNDLSVLKTLLSKDKIAALSTLQMSLLSDVKKEDSQITAYKEQLDELADIHRKNTASYNSVITAYNYYINAVPFKFIFKLFKFKSIELLS